jgi:hypothetical protein
MPDKPMPTNPTPDELTPGKAAPTKAAPAAPKESTRKAAAESRRPDSLPTTGVPADDQGSSGASPLWVDDAETAEIPVQEPKKRGLRRFGRRSGDDGPS